MNKNIVNYVSKYINEIISYVCVCVLDYVPV